MILIKSPNDIKKTEKYFNQDVYRYIYHLGDFDDFYWPKTTLYAHQNREGIIVATILLYQGFETPVVLALSKNNSPMEELFEDLRPILPLNFYAHFDLGLDKIFQSSFQIKFVNQFFKMALIHQDKLLSSKPEEIIRLDASHIHEIKNLYKISYPGLWFDSRMLQTGQYWGLRVKKELVSIAGVHVYSPQFQVAALGNVATCPDHRGKGYAKKVVSWLCQSLLKSVNHIGLNVQVTNTAAIKCYQSLGFDIHCTYQEGELLCR